MTAERGSVDNDQISDVALGLADAFLHQARQQILELAHDDLEKLRTSAAALRDAATDRSSQRKSSEQIAYALVASAFNEVLTNRTATPARDARATRVDRE